MCLGREKHSESMRETGLCDNVEQATADEVVIAYEVFGLPAGLHAFHAHETANFTSGCASTG